LRSDFIEFYKPVFFFLASKFEIVTDFCLGFHVKFGDFGSVIRACCDNVCGFCGWLLAMRDLFWECFLSLLDMVSEHIVSAVGIRDRLPKGFRSIIGLLSLLFERRLVSAVWLLTTVAT
jgi:hypothetical protein